MITGGTMSTDPDRDASITYHARQGRSDDWIAAQVRLPVAAVRRIIKRELAAAAGAAAAAAAAPAPVAAPISESFLGPETVQAIRSAALPERPGRARRLGDQDPIGCLEQLGLGGKRAPWRYCQRPTLPGRDRCDQHGGRGRP
jgi:hypothetical protein